MMNARFVAMKKVIVLAEALKAFGIDESDITIIDDPEFYIGVRINAWYCVDGSNSPISFVFDASDDYAEPQVIAEPDNLAKMFKKLLS